MWPGPYGEFGSRKYLLASLDQSLARMGLDYVDIFYSHRFDPDTPLRGDDGRARQRRARGQGALRRHLLLRARAHRSRPARILRELGTPLLIHQPSYSMLNRWIEDELLDVLEREGVGAIVFSPLAQGLLTDKYLRRRPGGLARAPRQLLLRRDAQRGEPRARPRAERDRRAARADARAAGDRLGAARRARHLGAARRQQRAAARAERRGAAAARLRRPTSSPRSTATRRRAGSTCGPSRAAREPR